ncbi:septation regulator SpoVG [Christensenellaceae bacterium NSJ-63]|uniref:Putative septation protein SpoVG n=1 Tax=Guopingia tenuis TaxID=2763656 RepID=A0A926DIW5_9FIRM|nr:septation regulator SpoVG [Guopingia tenuis]MBC8538602.1 septation regulator SpoVG [Guopingia tenuis]MBS5644859.1 septation regulator SpoVG [Clostridiales bacterium]
MNITDIRIRRVSESGKMKAIVSVTFDDMFVVHDMKIIEGQNGLFIAMPSRKTPSGEYKDVAHPINTAAREELQERILEQYAQLPEEMEEMAGE